MIRSVVSIISGYVFWIISLWILWAIFGYGVRDVPPTGFLILSVFCESVFGLGVGYLTAVIAKRHPLRNSMILAAFFILGQIVSLVFQTCPYPVWILLTTIFIVAPCIALGGYIRKRQTANIN